MSSGLTATSRARPLCLRRLTRDEPSLSGLRPARLRFSSVRKAVDPADNGRDNVGKYVNKSDIYKRPGRSKKPEVGFGIWDGAPTQPRKQPTPMSEFERELERSSFTDSVLVPRLEVIGNARQRHRTLRHHHKAVTRQVFHERFRVELEASPANWRQLLEDMAQATPEESLKFIEDGIRIDFAAGVVERIMKDAGDDTFGPIRRRTGAIVKVLRDETAIYLSGTRQAINSATHEFIQIARKITVTRTYSPLAAGEAAVEEIGRQDDFFIPPKTRDEGALFKKKRVYQHAYLTPIPTEWTPETLRDYVISLVDTRMDKASHVVVYPSMKGVLWLDHNRAVTRRLVRLFRKLPSTDGVSCSVAKMALSHMASKGDAYLPELRDLFVFLDRRGTPLDTDLFNILLGSTVKTRNLRKFAQTIKLMTQRGFAPNLDTWFLFLRIFESAQIKSYILRAMNAKNMLATPAAIRRVAEEMAPYDAEHAARGRKSLDTFLQEQEERYGSNWLTCNAANKVLHVLGRWERYEDCFRLLDIMGERHLQVPESDVEERFVTKPDIVSYNTIVNYACIKNKMPLAVNVVRKMATHPIAQQPTSTILHLLFMMAWRSNLRTTVTVIWRYACLAQLTTNHMRLLVARLLHGRVGGARDPAMTARVYRALGGAALAHELGGGRAALAHAKALCTRTWGAHYPPGRLGTLAARLLPRALGGRAPVPGLGAVLAQSVLLDFKCLRARKISRLRDLMQSARVKSVPLWARIGEAEMRRVSLGPLDDAKPCEIRHDDLWQEDWESEGWESPPGSRARRSWKKAAEETASAKDARRAHTGSGAPAGAEARTGGTQEAAATTHEGDDGTGVDVRRVQEEKRMVMINPKVWDDERWAGDSAPAEGDQDDRTPLQRENEQAYLEALKKLAKDQVAFRYVLASPENGRDGSESKNRSRMDSLGPKDSGELDESEGGSFEDPFEAMERTRVE